MDGRASNLSAWRQLKRSPAAGPPVLGQLGVLEKHDVVIGARRGHCVPDALQGLLLIVGLERYLEDAEIIRLPDLGVGQGGGELHPSLAISRGAVMQHQHRDRVALRHVPRDSTSRTGMPAVGCQDLVGWPRRGCTG